MTSYIEPACVAEGFGEVSKPTIHDIMGDTSAVIGDLTVSLERIITFLTKENVPTCDDKINVECLLDEVRTQNDKIRRCVDMAAKINMILGV